MVSAHLQVTRQRGYRVEMARYLRTDKAEFHGMLASFLELVGFWFARATRAGVPGHLRVFVPIAGNSALICLSAQERRRGLIATVLLEIEGFLGAVTRDVRRHRSLSAQVLSEYSLNYVCGGLKSTRLPKDFLEPTCLIAISGI